MADPTDPPHPVRGAGSFEPPGVVVAVDVGGTVTKTALMHADGRLVDVDRVPTAVALAEAGEPTVGWLANLIAARAAAADQSGGPVHGFGVVVPGIVDDVSGWVVAAPNLGWRDVALRDRLTALSGLRGTIAHDVRSAGLAEWRGAGLPDRSVAAPEPTSAVGWDGLCGENLMFVPLGTGIAAAVMVDGRLLEAGGWAGEIGHIAVPAAGSTPCACGATGCLETVASAAGVARTYAATSGLPATAAEVADRARAGDPAALAAFHRAATGLAEAFAVAVSLFGCTRITLAGGLAGAADLLVPHLTGSLAGRQSFQRLPEITVSRLGADAGLVGAGVVGWDWARTHTADGASA